jgi:concanavalin A-like lectin/glucanase superfamily protein/Big-like domain-containing protein/purple acid phosphatase-like protein
VEPSLLLVVRRPLPGAVASALLMGGVLALSLAGPAAADTLPDPTLLPVATTAQVPLTGAYDALSVPSLAAGASYRDPTTSARIYKLTSATFPAASANWGHDYSEGGQEVSLPYNGETRAVLVRQNGGPWWLVDFTPGTGVGNPRPLTGNLAPFMDIAFTFSADPATPYYAYVSSGSTIRRFDIRTMTEAPGNGWPVTGETSAMWLQQSENDAFFVWMRGANGTTVVGFEPATDTRKTYTNSGLNEPRIDRAGRYVGLSMESPHNGLVVWDWLTNSVAWSTPGDPGIPFSHNASLRRRWVSVDWNMSYPPDYTLFTPDLAGSARHIGGPANGTLIHGNGTWIQHPASLDDQWALFCHYGSLRPAESYWLAPGAFVLMTPGGERRILGHPYNTSGDYTYYTFAKLSPDGKYVLFTSNMNGSARSDVFLAEVPQTAAAADTTPPTVSITAPGAGIVLGTVTVAAAASDDVGVAGVRFRLDGTDLGAEDTSAPFSLAWNSLLALSGGHVLTAVARDAAGNTTTSSGVAVTVSNPTDTTPPALGAIGATTIGAAAATITWTTDEPADSQVDYGTSPSYGASTARDASAVVSHAQSLGPLAAATTYHYRVRSRDAAGNLAISGDLTLTTLEVPGPIAQWTLDDGAGVLAADSSGHANVGTLTGGPVWTAGRRDTGLLLDGVDDYVSVPHAPALDAFPLSVTAWFKTSTSAGVRGLVNKYVAGSYDGYQVFLQDGRLCAWYLRDTSNYVYDGGDCTMSTPGYNDGQWHQVAFVVDDSGGELYVDGALKASQPWTGTAGAPTTTQGIHLGHYPGAFGGAEFLPATIDEIRIYDRALGADEVSALLGELPPVGDAVPPVISNVGVSAVGSTDATVAWTTDEAADSQVQYGTTTAYGSFTPLSAALSTAHVQGLTGLSPGTVYHYRVWSADPAHNVAVSNDSVFATADTAAPVITSVSATGLSWWGATITWTTSEPADAQVEYGRTPAYGTSTSLDSALVASHSQALGGLAAGTAYHYRVKSRDAAGNLAVSGDFTFTAAPAPPTVAYWKLDDGSGNKAADASGKANTGTLQNGPLWTSGRKGGGLSLDGVNDFVRVPHTADLDAYPLTVTAWFKTSTTTGVRGLVNKYVANSYNGYQLFFDTGSLCAWYLRSTSSYVYDGTGCTMKTPGYNDGRWHQATLVVDASGGKLYVDGALKASRAWTGTAGATSTTQEIHLGHYPKAFGGKEYLNSGLDEVQIYNRAFTALEVQQLYNQVAGPVVP